MRFQYFWKNVDTFFLHLPISIIKKTIAFESLEEKGVAIFCRFLIESQI